MVLCEHNDSDKQGTFLSLKIPQAGTFKGLISCLGKGSEGTESQINA